MDTYKAIEIWVVPHLLFSRAAINPNSQELVISDLEKNKVKLVLIDTSENIWGKYNIKLNRGNVYEFIQQKYQPIESTKSADAKVF